MIEMNYLAIVAAAAAAFVAAGGYYAAVGKQLEKLSSAPADMPPWLLAVEVAKHFVVAAVVAGLAAGIGITAWPSALLLGLALWVAFPAVLLLIGGCASARATGACSWVTRPRPWRSSGCRRSNSARWSPLSRVSRRRLSNSVALQLPASRPEA